MWFLLFIKIHKYAQNYMKTVLENTKLENPASYTLVHVNLLILF